MQVKVEILSFFPTFYSICKGCQLAISASGFHLTSEMFKEYPDNMKESYKEICNLAFNLSNYFGNHIKISAIDISTPKGIWKSLRYKIKKYPAFIINGKYKIIGIPSFEEIKEIIIDELKHNK